MDFKVRKVRRSADDIALQASQLLGQSAHLSRDPDVVLACQLAAMSPLLAIRAVRGTLDAFDALVGNEDFLLSFTDGMSGVLGAKLDELAAMGVDTELLRALLDTILMFRAKLHADGADMPSADPVQAPPPPCVGGPMRGRGVIPFPPVLVTEDPDGTPIVQPRTTLRVFASSQEVRVDLPWVSPDKIRIEKNAQGEVYLDALCLVPLRGYGGDPTVQVEAPFRFRGFVEQYRLGHGGIAFRKEGLERKITARWDAPRSQLVIEECDLRGVEAIAVQADTSRVHASEPVAPIVLPGTQGTPVLLDTDTPAPDATPPG